MLTEVRAEQILFLKTYDRYNGKLMIHPLFFRRYGENYVVVASNETATYKPEWYLNLKEEPVVEIDIDGHNRFAFATTPVGNERMAVWPLVDELSKETERFLPRNVSAVLLTPME